MKAGLVIASVAVFLLGMHLSQEPGLDYGRLYRAIAAVEGDRGEVGKSGAVGPLQITDVCREDLRRFGLRLARDDCRDPRKARQALETYCQAYGARSVRDAARLWNSGPSCKYGKSYSERVAASY